MICQTRTRNAAGADATEIVVANNNSTDETSEVVNRYSKRLTFPMRQALESRPDAVRRVLEAGLAVVYDAAFLVYHHVPRGRMRRSYFWCWIYGYTKGKVNVQPSLPGRSPLGLPRWMYPRLLGHGPRLAGAPVSLRRQIDFFWELELFAGWYKRARAQRSVGR